MKFNIFKDFNNAFHVNKLYLANTDPLLNQSMDNTQSFSIQKNGEKEFVIKDIMAEMKNKKKKK